ncbi:MAG: tRNA pseudouridine(55) synthase TruB [Clostridiales bacterium]|nr:tRNA pseudouridine(55) synthase TruB [Clostridiales bacterium]
MDGFVNFYKEPGFTSHDAVAFLRRRLGQKRIGHTGTLDPAASGVLPLCLGKATKLAEYFNLEACRKSYRGEICFGLTTDSYDGAGNVIDEQDASHLTEARVRAELPKFTNEIEQVPPMVSALKYQGQPLYKLARKGQEVERPARRVMIYKLEVVEIQFGGPRPKLTLDITCSKGTYIRSLAHDLGQALGVGAHLAALCRLTVGPFCLEDAWKSQDIDIALEAGNKDFLLPPAFALPHLPVVRVNEEAARSICHGNAALYQGEIDGLCQIWDKAGILLAIGRAVGGCLLVDKVLVDIQVAE